MQVIYFIYNELIMIFLVYYCINLPHHLIFFRMPDSYTFINYSHMVILFSHDHLDNYKGEL